MKKKKRNVITGLDIGTTKVCAVIGEITDSGKVYIIGVGSSPSRGLKKSVVVNIDSTVESIKRAIDVASKMAEVEISSVFTGIAGGHVRGINSHGVISVSVSKKEVTKEDIERVIASAQLYYLLEI